MRKRGLHARELGGGSHGYLGITMINKKHKGIAGHDYMTTHNPGTVPIMCSNATGFQIVAAQDLHKRAAGYINKNKMLQRP